MLYKFRYSNGKTRVRSFLSEYAAQMHAFNEGDHLLDWRPLNETDKSSISPSTV